MNAFQRMMHSASQQADSKRKKLKRTSTEKQQHAQQQHHKRPSLGTDTRLQESVSPADEANTADAADEQQASASCISPDTAAVSSHHDAVAAFRRVFSGRTQHRTQGYDYFLVYDLEATCNQSKDVAPVEIIELSCVLVSTHTAEIQGSYQVCYVSGR